MGDRSARRKVRLGTAKGGNCYRKCCREKETLEQQALGADPFAGTEAAATDFLAQDVGANQPGEKTGEQKRGKEGREPQGDAAQEPEPKDEFKWWKEMRDKVDAPGGQKLVRINLHRKH